MRTSGVVLAAASLAVLTACGPGPTPTDAEPVAAKPSASASSTAPAIEEETFVLPTLCSAALPASRLATFAEQNLVLLGGPEGRYGNEYSAEPTPEERAGGITCIWGPSDTEESVITVSVAPLSASTYATTVDSLVAQGLNETLDDGFSTYWQQGDEVREPAILNVLRSSSWISVIQSIGGDAAFNEALAIADEAYEMAYEGG